MIAHAWLHLWFACEPCWRLQLRSVKHALVVVWVQP